MPQPSTITLAVDTLNTGSTTDEDYDRFDDSTPNRATYHGENHSFVARDQLVLYRTFPKPAGNFRGVAKSSVKFTVDQVVEAVDGSDLSAPVLLEISWSIPVGVSEAFQLYMRQKAMALLDLDAVIGELNARLVV